MWQTKKSQSRVCVISIYSITFAADFLITVHRYGKKLSYR